MTNTPPEPSNNPTADSAQNPGTTSGASTSGAPQYQGAQNSTPSTGQPVNAQRSYSPNQSGQSGYGYVPGQDAYGNAPQGTNTSREPSFFKALFDLSFKNFITIRFAGVLFVIGLAGIVLFWLVMTVASFTDSAVAGVLTFLIGAVIAFVYIVLFRVTIEFYVAMVRTAQNTSQLLEQSRQR